MSAGSPAADDVVVVFPPADFIAVNEHWYYKDHGHWRYYRTEPGFLRERRKHREERQRERERARYPYHR